MLDNQTRMREMLNLIESVDQGKKIKLNESYNGSLDEGPYTRLNTYRIKGQDMIDYLANESGAQVEMRGDDVGILTVDIISFPELAKLAANLAQQGKITPVAGPATRDMTGKGVFSNIKYPMSGIDESSGSSSDVEELANDALDAAALSIQNALGVEHGDFAGTFFTGEIGDTILEILKDYAREEMKNQSENDDSDYVDDEESNNSYYDSDREGDSNTRSNQFESGEGNSSSREKAIDGGAYEKWDPKHPNFVKNYKKFKASNPEGTLKDFIAKLKKGLAEGVRLKKFRQVADILKTLPENNRKILAKRHCKIFENHNSRFNSKKFMTYIGLNEGDVEDFLARGGKIQQGAPTDKKTPRARISSYTDHSMRKGEQGRRGRGYQDYDPDDHQSRNDEIDYPTKDIRKPEYESKQMNEDGYGNGEIEVNFINSGTGQQLGMKTVQAGSITLDNYGRPVMKVSSPFASGNTLMANFDSKTGGWVVDLD